MGCDVSVGDSWVEVNAYQKKLKPISVTTLPHPGFPTDLQAPMMALLATIDGVSVIQDTVYNDRFTHIAELCLGADIQLTGNTAHAWWQSLSSAPIMASDLRAGAALVLASLLAEGETSISRIYHIDRGYENFEEKMRSIGAQIRTLKKRVNSSEFNARPILNSVNKVVLEYSPSHYFRTFKNNT